MKLGAGEKTIVLLAASVVVVAGLKLAQPLVLPIFFAIAIAAITQPAVAWLERRRVPHVLAIVLAVLLDLGVIAGIASVVGSSAQDFYARLPDYQTKIGSLIRASMTSLSARGIRLSPDQTARLLDINRAVELGTSAARGIAGLVSDSILVLLLVVFMLLEVSRWRVKIAYAMGAPNADIGRFEQAADELQKYLLVKSLMCLVTAVLSGIWVAIWNVDFVLLWALLAFVLNYIPTIGSFIAGVPPVLVALVQLGPGPALGVAIGYAVINVLIGTAVEPRVMGRALGLSPLVVLLSLVFWGWLWGPVGALLSAPLTMVLKVAMSHTKDMRWLAILLGSSTWVERQTEQWAKEPPVSIRPSGDPGATPVARR
jgi:AI-2 transport protein TqsA